MKTKHKIVIAVIITSVVVAAILASSLRSIETRYDIEAESREFKATQTFVINEGIISADQDFNLTSSLEWADQHKIKIVGTNKTSGDMYLKGFNKSSCELFCEIFQCF